MKKLFIISAMAAMSLPLNANREARPTFTEWHDMQVNEVNRFPLHTDFFTYESLEKALKGDKTASLISAPPISSIQTTTMRHGT